MSVLDARLSRVGDYVGKLGYHPVYVSLHGSQNYGLDVFTEEYQSDFDYKCIILPTLQELVNNSKPVSTVVDFEGGQIDIKDIRTFIETATKMNPSYLEVLVTPFYKVFDEGGWIYNIRDMVSILMSEMGLLFAKACYGMFLEKKRAMEHPYPTIAHKIAKWGYDGKQTHHMYRLLLMLRDFKRFGKMVLIPPSDQRQFLLDLKLNRYPIEDARRFVEEWEAEITKVREELEEEYKNIKLNAKRRIISLSQSAVYDFCCSAEGRKKKND